MLFGITEEEIAESFSTIGDEVLTFSSVEGKKKLGNDPYSGWKAETVCGFCKIVISSMF